jgi:hypothetical protein
MLQEACDSDTFKFPGAGVLHCDLVAHGIWWAWCQGMVHFSKTTQAGMNVELWESYGGQCGGQLPSFPPVPQRAVMCPASVTD